MEQGMAIGIAIGAGVGVALDNVAIGVGISFLAGSRTVTINCQQAAAGKIASRQAHPIFTRIETTKEIEAIRCRGALIE